MINTDIVTSIDQRLTEAKAEIAQLKDARQALINGDASAVKQIGPRVPPKRKTRKTVRRENEVVPAGKLTALRGDHLTGEPHGIDPRVGT